MMTQDEKEQLWLARLRAQRLEQRLAEAQGEVARLSRANTSLEQALRATRVESLSPVAEAC